MHHRLVLAASILLSIISTAVLAASQTYTTLDPPGCGYAAVYAMSANGTIAGYCTEFFVISAAGEYSYYRIPYGRLVDLTAVNNAGSTTGRYSPSLHAQFHEYARTAKGKVWYLDPPRSANAQAEFAGINNLNQVSGDQEQSDGISQGFVADLFGQLTLYAVPGASDTFGGFINDSGVVAGSYYSSTIGGTHAYVRDQFGNITPFDVPGAGTESAQGTFVGGLNSAGQISGAYVDSNYVAHGYIRNTDGTLTTFDAPNAGSGFVQGTWGMGINDAGEVAGYYYDSSYVAHGFFRDQSGNITEFDDPSAGTGEGQGTMPVAISNTGILAGIYYDSNFTVHAFKRQ
jgi:hypothetical protein